MAKRFNDFEKLFSISESIEYKVQNSSYKESLTKILEALYIQKIKETNEDYLSRLSFYEILNLPSLVSESIFHALISEPREHIKLEEFVDGLTILFDKNIDFDYDPKIGIPKIYEIIYKIFCLKKIKEKLNKCIDGSSQTLSYSVLSSERNFPNNYVLNYEFNLESFNKIISNILLVFFTEANHFDIDEFLPLCEEIKLIVKKTFTINYKNNINYNNFNNASNTNDQNSLNYNTNSTINFNFTSSNNCFSNNLKNKMSNENEEEITCSNLNINLNLNNQAGGNMNFNMNMQNNIKMNLNLNINNLSNISQNQIYHTNHGDCPKCKLCLNCSKTTSLERLNSKVNDINHRMSNLTSVINPALQDFVQCLQNNSKLLFILLFLFYSICPINQKLIYLLMKNPTSKIIDDECDFNEEDEKTHLIQSVPVSMKKVNLEEIKTNSRVMSENNSVNNSFERNSVGSNNQIERNLSINSNNSKNLSNRSFELQKAELFHNPHQENNKNKNGYIKELPSQGRIVFDLNSEDTDSFGQNNYSVGKSLTNSRPSSSSNLNNFTNKSKFFNSKSLFDKTNNLNKENKINMNIVDDFHDNIEENIEYDNSRLTNFQYQNDDKYYNHKYQGSDERKNKNRLNNQKDGLSIDYANTESYYEENRDRGNENFLNNDSDNYSNVKIDTNFNNKSNNKMQVMTYNVDNNNNISIYNQGNIINVNQGVDSSNKVSTGNKINFNLDDDSDTFSKNQSENNEKKNNFNLNFNKYKTDRENNNLPKDDPQSHIIVYRHDQTNESSNVTNNNNIFDTRFRNSFDNILISHRDENANDNTNNLNNIINDFSRINTKNSIYNDFNEFLFDKNKINGNKNNFNINRSRSSKFLQRNGTGNESLFTNNMTKNENLTNTKILNLYGKKNKKLEEIRRIQTDLNMNDVNDMNQNKKFAFEEVFAEVKMVVQKVKISKDFIFDHKKCENFTNQFKTNTNFSFGNFNFNIENDWLIKSLKIIYHKTNEKRISEIKNINRNVTFLTVFYQFSNSENENNSSNKYSKNSYQKLNLNTNNDEAIIKEKSKRLTKSIADLIDEYLVIFTFRNAFEANYIHAFLSENKEKLIQEKNHKEFDNEEIYNNLNKNPTKNTSSNNSNNRFGTTFKETAFGFEDKTTNYRLNTVNGLSQDSNNFKNNHEYVKYNNQKSNDNFTNKKNINTKNETNSDVVSVLDLYESNDFFSLNLKTIINLRNSSLIPVGEKIINEITFYPLKIKQEDSIHIIFFETKFEREILTKYHSEKILNINPLRNYDSYDVISKNKCLEFTKGIHKETKECVEIKKYIKNKIKSEKILKEINRIRDLSIVYRFFADAKIPKILFFENAEEIFVVYENTDNDPIKFIFMNPDLKVTKDISKYSLNIKKMRDLKNMLDILSISFSPDKNVDL